MGEALLASSVVGLSHAMPAAHLLVCLGVGHIGVADTAEALHGCSSVQITLGRCVRAAEVHALAAEAGHPCFPYAIHICCCTWHLQCHPAAASASGSVPWLQKLERLRSELHFIGTAARNTHTVFVDNDGQAQAFSPGESCGCS